MLLVVGSITSCSRTTTQQNIIQAKKKVTSLNKSNDDRLKELSLACSFTKNDNDLSVKRYECIVDIATYANSLLTIGDSPTGLLVAKLGMVHFGYDDRIKTIYEKALDTFRKSTNLYISKGGNNCDIVLSRLSFLKRISPDTHIPHEKCKALVINKVTPLNFNENIQKPTINRKDEARIFSSIGKKLKYQIVKNNEDNYREVVIRSINSLKELSFNTKKISLSKNIVNTTQRVGLVITASTDFSFKATNEYCEYMGKNFNNTDLNNTYCMINKERDEHRQVYFGTRDFRRLKNQYEGNFDRLLPNNPIFSIKFTYEDGKEKKYYYRGRNGRGMYPKNINRLCANWNCSYHRLLKKSPTLLITGGPLKLGFQDNNLANTQEFTIKIDDVSQKDINDVVEIKVSIEPKLTYLVYMNNNNEWKKVVLKSLNSKK